MSKYEKWLGAGLGWAVGGPLGGLLGFVAGVVLDADQPAVSQKHTSHTSEFEINLLILAANVIKADGQVNLKELDFTREFISTHFGAAHVEEKMNILHHCFQKNYSIQTPCEQLRMNYSPSTRIQVLHFLFELAQCDGDLTATEKDSLFRTAGYLNINDVEFRNLLQVYTEKKVSDYDLFGIKESATEVEIKLAYRKLVLKYHPDRNTHLSEAEQKVINQKFQQVQEAFERLKR